MDWRRIIIRLLYQIKADNKKQRETPLLDEIEG